MHILALDCALQSYNILKGSTPMSLELGMSLELLSDRVALQDLMLNYAAAVDERDLDRYTSCFAEDVEIVGFGEQAINGRALWVDHVWGELAKYAHTQHLLGPQLATVNGDTADTRSDVQALHLIENPAEDNGFTRFILWATYNTSMRRIDGQWKIQRHELVVRATGS